MECNSHSSSDRHGELTNNFAVGRVRQGCLIDVTNHFHPSHKHACMHVSTHLFINPSILPALIQSAFSVPFARHVAKCTRKPSSDDVAAFKRGPLCHGQSLCMHRCQHQRTKNRKKRELVCFLHRQGAHRSTSPIDQCNTWILPELRYPGISLSRALRNAD